MTAMKRIRSVICVTAAVALVAASVFSSEAEARAGNGGSSGSRGSRTYVPNRAAPMQRSMTQPPSSTLPQQQAPRLQTPAPSPMPAPSYGAQGSSFGRNLMAGVAGGFLGAGLFSLFSGGHRAYADGSGGTAAAGQGSAAAGFASLLSILLQLALIGGLVWLVWRWLARRRDGGNSMPKPRYSPAEPAYQTNTTHFTNTPSAGPWGSMGGSTGGSMGSGATAAAMIDPTRPLTTSEADEEKFSQLLLDVQNAWSHGDLNKLRRLMTPEMVMYFSDELSSLSSRGLINRIEDVEFLGGQVEEAWSEEGRDYASARIQFRARDYTVSIEDENRVVQGSKTAHTTIDEVWTFVRASNGGAWIVSAIQQV